LTHIFFLTSIVLEGGSSNRISIRGAHRGDRLLNPGIPRPREVGFLAVIFNSKSDSQRNVVLAENEMLPLVEPHI
jgi:hypothetical protein